MTAQKKKPKSATRPPKKPAAAKPPAARHRAARADFGAPTADYFARQPPPLRAILEALRTLVEEAAPDADSSLKWGMPFYTAVTASA